jgi:hypothetical protein
VRKFIAVNHGLWSELIGSPVFNSQEMCKLPIQSGGGPLFFITTYEKKTGFLLIEVFRKLFNPQDQGHRINVGWPFVFIQTMPIDSHHTVDIQRMC